MKIPQYTSQATPSSEAPGRSFGARMQSQPYVQAEIEKGNVLGEALGQAASYADMRYKMAREAKLNDALIAADEQLREETDRLSKSGKLYNVLDGDNPLWNKNVEGIRTALRSTIGKDREALRAFDEKFKQTEMSQRFKLRGVIDAKIKQQIALQRTMKLERAEANSVEARSIDEIFLNLSDAKVDGMRAISVLKANPDALAGQQGALLVNITKRRIQKILDEAENPIAVISALRSAAFDGNQSDIAKLGVGVVEAELLSMIPASDRAAILRGGETLASYIDGPTLEEKAILERKGSDLQILSTDASNLSKMIEKNISISDEQIEELEGRLAGLTASLPADLVAPVRAQLDSIKDYRSFRNDMIALKTPEAMSELLNQMEGKANKTPDDANKIEFARKVFASTLKDIEEDVVAWSQKTNAVPLENLDLTFGDPEASSEQFRRRAVMATTLHNISGRQDAGRPVRIFSDEEEKAFIANFENAPLSQKMTTLMSIENAFRDTGYEPVLYDLYAKIGEDNPLIAHAGGLISMGRNEAAREIFQGLEQLKAGVQIPTQTSLGTSTSAVISTYLQEALRFQPEATGAIIKATEAIIANRFIGLSKNELTEKLVIEAMQTAAGQYQKNGVTLGGLQLVNNAQTFMPKDASVDRFEQVMDNLTPEMMAMMGYEVDPGLWSQVADGDWTFQVAGEGQYRIMKDAEPSSGGVPTFLNGYALNRDGQQEPVLIDFYKAEELLIKERQSQTVSGITELGATGATSKLISVPESVASPDMPTAAQDVAPGLMEGFEETKGIFSAQMAAALKDAKTAAQKSKAISKLVPPDRFKTTVQPLLESVPDDVSDDKYLEYVDAVLNGFNKPFRDWNAAQ